MLTANRARPSDSIPSSSMADIAFLLLVFFLVTTVFPKDRGLGLVLPQTETEVNPGNVLQFLVDPGGTIGVVRGNSTETQVVRAEAVGGIWRDEMARNPQLIALVRTASEARYERMVDVLDQLRAAGAKRISLQMDADRTP